MYFEETEFQNWIKMQCKWQEKSEAKVCLNNVWSRNKNKDHTQFGILYNIISSNDIKIKSGEYQKIWCQMKNHEHLHNNLVT